MLSAVNRKDVGSNPTVPAIFEEVSSSGPGSLIFTQRNVGSNPIASSKFMCVGIDAPDRYSLHLGGPRRAVEEYTGVPAKFSSGLRKVMT